MTISIRSCCIYVLKNSFFILYFYNMYFRVMNKKRFLLEIERRRKLPVFAYQELARPLPFYPQEFVKDSNFYGQSDAIKTFAGVQKLGFAIEHGLYYDDYIPIASFYRTIRRIITFSIYRQKVIQTRLCKPVIPVGPYIHYARPLLNADAKAEIKKTYGKILLFFPSHSCVDGKQMYDVMNIIEKLKELCLVGGFKSVFVNMYYYDILHTDYAKYYSEAGFKIVTAGHQLDKYFLSRLKSIIELSDYTVSNSVGTHLGYCIWMGRPHYIIDDKIINRVNSKDYKKIGSFFLTYTEMISPEQYAVVSKYWGFDSVKTSKELESVLKFLD